MHGSVVMMLGTQGIYNTNRKRRMNGKKRKNNPRDYERSEETVTGKCFTLSKSQICIVFVGGCVCVLVSMLKKHK